MLGRPIGSILSRNGPSDKPGTIQLDWDRLSLQQKGTDTARIDAIYKVHYLQWTGNTTVDKFVGAIGLILLVTLTLIGARLAFGWGRGTGRRV